MKETKDKIEEDIRESIMDFLSEDERFYGKQDGTESITEVPERLIKEICQKLSTLIQEERKNAVRGFVDTIEWEKIDGVDDDDTIRGRNLVEQMETYLQSLDKGDTDENR